MRINVYVPGRLARAAVTVLTVAAFAFTAAGTAAAVKAAQVGGTVQDALRGSTSLSPEQLEALLSTGGGDKAVQSLGFNGAYDHIVNNNSNQCLAVPGGSTAAGTGLIQWPCGSWKDHYWSAYYQFKDSTGVYWYHVQNYNSQQCLAVPGASTTAGTQVIQWPCGTWSDHYWAFVLDSTNRLHIVNHNSGQCLAVPGASTTAGEKIIQWPCGTWNDHYWH
ncbi:RICIN domain-containing protein [Kitasatospora sp. NPDC085879]|uniref:RICIN domain-containing protein n=1 Tax=Kitasatospora sp. NPDC085879 TaxID=3154769 RepID=UPI003444C239